MTSTNSQLLWQRGILFATILLSLSLIAAACGGDTETDPMEESVDEITEEPSMGTTNEPSGTTLTATLSGSAETDEDGSGTASVTIDTEVGEVCYEIDVSNIEDPTVAHIHRGAAGESGGVVVDFNLPENGMDGCVSGVDAGLANEIIDSPGNYYVNVHNSPFPGGAIRGQLMSN